MEALARWQVDGRLVNPGEFIGIAEQSGLIVPLAEQIYSAAFRETAKLLDRGYALKLSVNLAPVQLKAKNFVERLVQLQKESGLSAGSIELEVTESAIMDDVEKSKELLAELVDLGFEIAVDDFGTGYSSLGYLKQLPIRTLKIDRSFVIGIGRNRDDEILIRTIIMMAKQFGLNMVAEGIEERSQIDFLSDLECNQGQGFYFGRPMAAEAYDRWLREWRGWSPSKGAVGALGENRRH